MIKVWGHRGASGYAPENTLPSFALAAEMGADGIELDVQLSADGEVVVIHDETVDRTTNGTGAVKNFTAAELASLDAGLGEPIPRLDEVFSLLKPTNLVVNVELKNSIELYPGMEAKVLEIVAAHDMGERVILSSFNHMSLAGLRQVTSLPLGVLFSDVIFEQWNYGQTFGANALHPHWGMLQIPGYVANAHAAGLAVHPWTVNDDAAMGFVVEQGVDAIITNFPDRALAAAGR